MKNLTERIITVYVKPQSKHLYIKQLDDKNYEIAITSKPEKGKANKEIIEELANFFKIKKTQIQILKGHKSREKKIQIMEFK